MAHERSQTISYEQPSLSEILRQRYTNVSGLTGAPLDPMFDFERMYYPTLAEALSAARWRSELQTPGHPLRRVLQRRRTR